MKLLPHVNSGVTGGHDSYVSQLNSPDMINVQINGVLGTFPVNYMSNFSTMLTISILINGVCLYIRSGQVGRLLSSCMGLEMVPKYDNFQ